MRTIGLVASATLAGCLGRPPADRPCTLQIQLVDAGTETPIPGLLEMLDAAGSRVPVGELLDRGLGVESEYSIHRWSVLPGPTRLQLARGVYTVNALSGLETELTSQSVACLDTSGSVRVPLRRFFDAAQRGYTAGNTHVHLQNTSALESDRYLREVPRADGLEVVFVSYLERPGADTAYSSNRYGVDDLRRLSTPELQVGGGEELRHNFGAWGEGYGHLLFLNLRELIRPASVGPGISGVGTDGIPLETLIAQGRSLGATVIWAHNNWGLEDVPSWITGRIDAMNVFDGDDSTVPMRTYRRALYRYLNVGLRVPLSAGTDWFIYDFSRAYVRGDSALSLQGWLGGLKRGRSFITNGPLVELEVDGHGPGDILEVTEPRAMPIVARAFGRVDFKRLELVRNGEVVGSAPSRPEAGHFVAEVGLSLPVAEAAWVAARTPPPFEEGEGRDRRAPEVPLNEFGRELFAHTSPVYLRFRGRDVLDTATATGLLDEMAANRRFVEQEGRFTDDAERDRVLRVYGEGLAALRRRLGRDR